MARASIPISRLVEQVCDDGSDYDDGVMGYCSGTWDQDARILTLRFKRDDETEADDGDDWGSATYRFQFVSGEAP